MKQRRKYGRKVRIDITEVLSSGSEYALAIEVKDIPHPVLTSLGKSGFRITKNRKVRKKYVLIPLSREDFINNVLKELIG